MGENRLVKIHGDYYDLSNFAEKHPGGIDIIKTSEKIPDATPLFESHHANSGSIIRKIAQYKRPVHKTTTPPTQSHPEYDYKSYNRLKRKVYASIGNVRYYKFYRPVDLLCVIGQTALCIYLLQMQNMYCAFLAGCIFTGVSVGVMHSAGHYSFLENRRMNEFFFTMTAISSFCIPGNLWRIPHNYFHHLYTGSRIDPDINNYGLSTHELSHKKHTNTFMKVVVIFLIFTIPGQLTGLLHQHIQWYSNTGARSVCGETARPEINRKEKSIILISLMINTYLAVHFPREFFPYIVGMNFSFAAIVVPDHDTLETRNNNPKTNDWGEIQICESANFSERNIAITYLFGGINYQIEHHLFPNLPPHLYPQISKIVKKHCKEEGITYVSFPTWFHAFSSFWNNCINS